MSPPIYEYEPENFSAQNAQNKCCFFEVLQSFKDKPLLVCPKCQNPVRKKMSLFSSSFSKKESSKLSKNLVENESSAKKTAKLTMQHVCNMNCNH